MRKSKQQTPNHDQTSLPLYLAMWSGPRNISTAMMRSFGNRTDTYPCDEPFYAHYLLKSGLNHPGRSEIVNHHESDAEKIINWLTGPIPEGKSIFYQKLMAHHLLPHMSRTWFSKVTHAFLIRNPRDMLRSLKLKLQHVELADTGLPQQVEIFNFVRATTGMTPPVLDAVDVLENPKAMLAKLCNTLGIPFDHAMLKWNQGTRPTDGIWSKHWYANVEQSTEFHKYQPNIKPFPEELNPLLEACLPPYQTLYDCRLRA